MEIMYCVKVMCYYQKKCIVMKTTKNILDIDCSTKLTRKFLYHPNNSIITKLFSQVFYITKLEYQDPKIIVGCWHEPTIGEKTYTNATPSVLDYKMIWLLHLYSRFTNVHMNLDTYEAYNSKLKTSYNVKQRKQL